MSFTFTSYRGDATNEEATERAKIHIGEVSTIVISEHAAYADVVPETSFPYTRSICDSKKVLHGTASELYELISNEFDSVGCPLWNIPVCQLDGKHIRTCFVYFGQGAR